MTRNRSDRILLEIPEWLAVEVQGHIEDVIENHVTMSQEELPIDNIKREARILEAYEVSRKIRFDLGKDYMVDDKIADALRVLWEEPEEPANEQPEKTPQSYDVFVHEAYKVYCVWVEAEDEYIMFDEQKVKFIHVGNNDVINFGSKGNTNMALMPFVKRLYDVVSENNRIVWPGFNTFDRIVGKYD